MKRLLLPTLFIMIALMLVSCNDPTNSTNNNGFNNQQNNILVEVCDNGADDDGDSAIDCDDPDCWTFSACIAQNNTNTTNNNVELFTLRGKVWSPGSDDPSVRANNKLPVSQALVAAYLSEPDAPTEGVYCNKCVEIPGGVIHTFTDFDGSFELELYPEFTYWIVVQKGEFRRVTMYTTGEAGGSEDLDAEEPAVKPEITTLPNVLDRENGAYIPKILVIKGSYEEMEPLFSAVGFSYGVDIVEVDDTDADSIVADMNELRKYNLIITTCGDDATFLTNTNMRANLKQYVMEGGKLYVDDFSYDWAEQPFPEFLTFENGSTDSCGDGTIAPTSVGTCNHWSSYDPEGTPGDPYFESWLDIINPSGYIELQAAWDIIADINPSLQGDCDDPEDTNCVDGNYIAPPKVWMYGDWSGYTMNPVTVSWNYYCGKVLYTVYHTHSGSNTGGYEYDLLLQEKIMLYLIMEIQTCTQQNIVE
ncbi:MAG: hypothetical protein JXR95_07790 [Deltaproteobacteria bacterium]|nr:hypothetical protein [Deltaproteobacteria bacterium]